MCKILVFQIAFHLIFKNPDNQNLHKSILLLQKGKADPTQRVWSLSPIRATFNHFFCEAVYLATLS